MLHPLVVAPLVLAHTSLTSRNISTTSLWCSTQFVRLSIFSRSPYTRQASRYNIAIRILLPAKPTVSCISPHTHCPNQLLGSIVRACPLLQQTTEYVCGGRSGNDFCCEIGDILLLSVTSDRIIRMCTISMMTVVLSMYLNWLIKFKNGRFNF